MWENQEAPPEPLPSHLTRSAKTDQMTEIVQRRREREGVDEPHTYVRAGAHDTEASAALRALPASGTQRRKALTIIMRAGEVGATDYEVAVAMQARPEKIASRRKELEEGGWVVDSGLRRPTATGSLAIVWKATSEGLQRWSERD